MRIANINRERSVDLTIPSKDGKSGPTVESIRAGESRNVDISADDPQIKVLRHTQQILIGADVPKAAPASSKPAAS